MIKLLILMFFYVSPAWAQFMTGPFGQVDRDININKHAYQCEELDSTPTVPNANELKFYCKDDSGTTKLYTLDENGTETLLGSGGSGSGTVNTGVLGYFSYYPASGTTVDDQTVLYTNATNIGVSTINPVATLHILNTGTGNSFRVDDAAGDTTPFVINSNGNVGIGTWAPEGLLQINKLSSSPFIVTSSGNVGIGTVDPQGAFIVTSGNVAIGTWVPVSGYQLSIRGSQYFISGSKIDWGNGNAYIKESGFALQFATWTGAAETEKMRILGDGNVGIGTTTPQGGLTVMNGNVGIGTWKPSVSLEITKDFNGQNTLLKLRSPSGYLNSSVDIDFVLTNTLPLARIGALRTNRIVNGDTSLIFSAYSNGILAERMRVQDDGNVGIGSTAPGQKLDVTGTVRATAFIGDGSGLTGLSGTGWTASGNDVYKTSNGNVGIGTTLTTTSALTVMNGNVGIGTWIPNSSIYINGSAAFKMVQTTTTYAVLATDYTVECTSGTFTVTLETAVGATGRIHQIKNSGSGTITIATTSSQTIDGQASGTITLAQYDSITVQSNGSNWIIL